MKRYLAYIAITILIIILILQCNKANNAAIYTKNNMMALTDSIKYYKNKLGTNTAYVKTLQFENEQLNKILINKDADLKRLTAYFSKLKSIVKYNNSIRFDSISIKFDEPITIKDTLPFKKTGTVNDKWYTLGYTVTSDSFIIAPFSTWTETTLITGFKRKWPLGKQILTTDITNTNPHIKITSIKSAEVIIPEPWYKKWYLWLAAGIAGGLLLN